MDFRVQISDFKLRTLGGLLAIMLPTVAARGASISYSIINPGSSTVVAGQPVMLEIRATFDTRLSAVQFTLSASGSAGASLTARSLNPTGTNGLTYLSSTQQVPFQSNLPVNLVTTSNKEVAYDADFDNAPGGPTDGLPPGSDVLIETITIVSPNTGGVVISLSNPRAAHTTTSPDGTMFDSATINASAASVTLSVVVPTPGDADLDGDVDLVDYSAMSACLSGPAQGDGFVPPSSACLQHFDLPAPDGDVDLADVAAFQNAFTGP
ncbi:MAG TPA: hypothetical protein VGM03_24390 [Phycisphaerae bacterium]|jgi:hypothetical protein